MAGGTPNRGTNGTTQTFGIANCSAIQTPLNGFTTTTNTNNIHRQNSMVLIATSSNGSGANSNNSSTNNVKTELFELETFTSLDKESFL